MLMPGADGNYESHAKCAGWLKSYGDEADTNSRSGWPTISPSRLTV